MQNYTNFLDGNLVTWTQAREFVRWGEQNNKYKYLENTGKGLVATVGDKDRELTIDHEVMCIYVDYN